MSTRSQFFCFFAWGGRASYKLLIVSSSFLSKLLPVDIALADHGFDTEEDVSRIQALYRYRHLQVSVYSCLHKILKKPINWHSKDVFLLESHHLGHRELLIVNTIRAPHFQPSYTSAAFALNTSINVCYQELISAGGTLGHLWAPGATDNKPQSLHTIQYEHLS